MDEPSDQTNAASTPALLDGWLTRARAAEEIGVLVDTLQRWEKRRVGPRCVRIGRFAITCFSNHQGYSLPS
jgi:hypothetical protein